MEYVESVQEKREQIVSVARRLAAKEGLIALTVRKLAREMGIGPSTLRYYFPSQEMLYEAVVIAEFDSFLSDFHIHDSTLGARERLVECLLQFLPGSSKEATFVSQWIPGLVTATPQADHHFVPYVLGLVSDRASARIAYWLDLLYFEGALPERQSSTAVALLCAVVNGLSLGIASGTPPLKREEVVELMGVVVDRVIFGASA